MDRVDPRLHFLIVFGKITIMAGWVYILASKPYGTLYTGVTNSLSRRIYEHREGITKGFTTKYQVHRLVWYEEYPTMPAAIHREKRLKKWKRFWKIALITELNPDWDDLYETLVY